MTRQQYGLPVGIGPLLQAPQRVLQQALGWPIPLMRGAPPAAASAGTRSARFGEPHLGLMPVISESLNKRQNSTQRL